MKKNLKRDLKRNLIRNLKRSVFWCMMAAGSIALAGCGKQNGSNPLVVEDGTGNAKAYGMEADAPKTDTDETVMISQEDAVSLVLERVPGATAEQVYIELEKDDGHWKYEGEIHYNKKEYEFELNAETGQIIEWSEEVA